MVLDNFMIMMMINIIIVNCFLMIFLFLFKEIRLTFK